MGPRILVAECGESAQCGGERELGCTKTAREKAGKSGIHITELLKLGSWNSSDPRTE